MWFQLMLDWRNSPYYILEESNVDFRYVRLCDLDIPREKCLNYLQIVEDPGQTPRSAASDLGLHCLPVILTRVSRLQWFTVLCPGSFVILYSKSDGQTSSSRMHTFAISISYAKMHSQTRQKNLSGQNFSNFHRNKSLPIYPTYSDTLTVEKATKLQSQKLSAMS